MRREATKAHNAPYSPMLRRFEVIEEETIGNRIVNGELLQWANASDGYTKTGRKVRLRSLDASGHDDQLPDAGSKVWAIWMYDTSVWEVVSGAGGGTTAGQCYLAKTVGVVSARSGTTPGTGTVVKQKRDPDTGAIADVEDEHGDPIEVTVYNWAQNSTGTYVYVWVCTDEWGDDWIVSEDCP